MNTTTTTNDVINEDGSVTRTTTIVQVQTLTPKQVEQQHLALEKQIQDMTTRLANQTKLVSQVQDKVSSLKENQPNIIK
jgi:hypothetical protein